MMDPHFLSEWKKGDRIGSFQVVCPAGRGQYGEVLIVRDLLGERFALKVLNPADESTRRELQGILQRRQALSSPAFVTLHHIDQLPDGRYYYTMDAADNLCADENSYIPDTLENRLRQKGAMNLSEIMPVLSALLNGLKEIHRQGIAHRDIKPDNILFCKGMPMLSDFGLMTQAGTSATLIGTPGFLPPECLSAKPDPVQWDLYAMGKVLYCMWTGLDAAEYPRIPDDRPLTEYKIVRRIYAKACAEHVRDRFRSADEFLQFPAQPEVGSRPAPALWITLIAVLFAGAVTAAWFLLRTPVAIPQTSVSVIPKEQARPEQKNLQELQKEPVFLTEEDRRVYRHVIGHSKEIQVPAKHLSVYFLKQETQDPALSPEERAEKEKLLAEAQAFHDAFYKSPAGILSLTAGRLQSAISAEDADGYLKAREQARKALAEYKRTHNDWQNCARCKENTGIIRAN